MIDWGSSSSSQTSGTPASRAGAATFARSAAFFSAGVGFARPAGVFLRATLPPAPSLEGMESGADPRRRPAELRVLAAGERRVVVAAASDALIRAAREAGFFALGISNGPCSTARLQQAGADVVYKSLEELADSIETGGADLIRAGLPPISFSDARS